MASTTRDGSRSTILLMPTEPDQAIAAAFSQASLTAICQMFDQPAPQPTLTGLTEAPGLTLPSTLHPDTLLR